MTSFLYNSKLSQPIYKDALRLKIDWMFSHIYWLQTAIPVSAKSFSAWEQFPAKPVGQTKRSWAEILTCLEVVNIFGFVWTKLRREPLWRDSYVKETIHNDEEGFRKAKYPSWLRPNGIEQFKIEYKK